MSELAGDSAHTHRIDHDPIGGLAGQKFAEGAETGENRGIKTTGLNTARGK